jgi:uncharacterized membrane protein YczE
MAAALRGGRGRPIESSAVALGFALGGTVGIGTLAFAFGIGPGVQAALGVLSSTPAHEL